MTAFGCALAFRDSPQIIAEALATMPAVPGRLERVRPAVDAPVSVYVDYAHTPDALTKAIASIKELSHGRTIVVFGCGGNRDATKRPIMGAAALGADYAVVTSDNPRHEEPDAIIADIVAGMEDAERFTVEPDRRSAIAAAIALARPGDAILVAGKGHEDYQLVGDEVLSFDDRVVAAAGVGRASAVRVRTRRKDSACASTQNKSQHTGGQFLVDPIDASALMTGITWDSREVRPGWLYAALPGERVDGHAFVEAALRAGAAGALVTDAPSQSCALLARELGAAIIEVPNTASAITDLARAWRSHLRGRVIGLTGSVGKTTTKNLTRDVCAAYGSVVATKANQNNELGVPRTLLNADPETAVVVVEMGMRGRGQIAELCDFVRPVWGLITNVGESHIELLGSRENIARAKSERFEALPAGVGRAFANLDDDFAAFMTERGRLSERSVALSGFAGHPDAALRGALERESAACDQAVWAEDVSLDAEGRPRFTLCARDAADHDDGALFATVERVPCSLSLTGAHNVDNACAAASVGFALGLDLATIAAALGDSVPEPGRQEVIAARGGFTVINDAYNASPDSMRASLATFAATDVAGRRIAVLGDMGELGSFAPACHEGVGAAAASHHLDKLICIGELARHIAAGAEAAGMDAARISRADTVADVLEELDALLEPGDAVLVKASHFMGLTRIVEGLVN